MIGLGEVRVSAEIARPAIDDAQAQAPLEHRHVEALDDRERLNVVVDQFGQASQVLARVRERT